MCGIIVSCFFVLVKEYMFKKKEILNSVFMKGKSDCYENCHGIELKNANLSIVNKNNHTNNA